MESACEPRRGSRSPGAGGTAKACPTSPASSSSLMAVRDAWKHPSRKRKSRSHFLSSTSSMRCGRGRSGVCQTGWSVLKAPMGLVFHIRGGGIFARQAPRRVSARQTESLRHLLHRLSSYEVFVRLAGADKTPRGALHQNLRRAGARVVVGGEHETV